MSVAGFEPRHALVNGIMETLFEFLVGNYAASFFTEWIIAKRKSLQ
jgi:hypothetical protein